MANMLDMQIPEEGYRNAVVKLTGTIDSGDIQEISVIPLTSFINNDPQCQFVGLRVDVIEWAISTGLEICLFWNSLTPQMIYPLSGRGRIVGKNYGGFVPNRNITKYDGSINLITYGASSSTTIAQVNPGLPSQVSNFTIVLEMVKMYTR